ncbi:MAG: hypothetical protein NW223_13085 [Hyphomicrobiaceae bacterium]|nr:hypothetical protein [Hyphomicrobiaceae bacterium]
MAQRKAESDLAAICLARYLFALAFPDVVREPDDLGSSSCRINRDREDPGLALARHPGLQILRVWAL